MGRLYFILDINTSTVYTIVMKTKSIKKILPKEFSLKKTGISIVEKQIDSIPYLSAINVEQEIKADFLSWYVMFAVSNKVNFEWTINGISIYIGSDEFRVAMNKAYGII